MPSDDFNSSVFVNCPFDADYIPLLRPLLFTLRYLGFVPRIALESTDSGEPRIQKIVSLIESSRYGIHDLSRLQAKKQGEYSRFNMPFELGVDIGCKLFRKGKWAQKRCLILEKEKYRYQIAISDLSNSDILDHNDQPEMIVKHVRNWLVQQCLGKGPSPTQIWYAYNDFWADTRAKLESEGFTPEEIDDLSVSEFITRISEWIKQD